MRRQHAHVRPGVSALLREACDRHGVHLIADEIAVGFGRTGTMFACEQAGIRPDFLCLSKGLTGGYLPLSAVLTTEPIYAAFYDEYAKLNAFLHSHSFTGNPLACAAALATLRSSATTTSSSATARWPRTWARGRGSWKIIRTSPKSGRRGMIVADRAGAGQDAPASPIRWQERRGLRVYRHALERGVLLRPVGNVVYFMPPYVITPEEIELMVDVAREGIELATCD